MSAGGRRIKLGLSMRGLGYHASAWRHPDVPGDGAMSFDFYRNVTQIAERGLLAIADRPAASKTRLEEFRDVMGFVEIEVPRVIARFLAERNEAGKKEIA